MKKVPAAFLLGLTALSLPAFSAHALDPSRFNDGFAPLTPELARFFTDLEAIPAGSTVTDAQHGTLAADLAALPPGPAAPDAAALDQLADSFGRLAVAGLVDDDAEYLLAMDFEVDPDDADSWFTYVQGDVSYLLMPPPTLEPGDGSGVDPVIYQTFGPTDALASQNELLTRQTLYLRPVYPEGSGSTSYSGEVRLNVRQFPGLLTVPTLRVSTYGLALGETYTVRVTRRSDGKSVMIGKFHARGSGQPLPQPVLAEGSLPDGALPIGVTLDTRSSVAFGPGAKRPLPAGFDADDVAAVRVVDSRGRTRLVRKITDTGAHVSRTRRVRLHLTGPAGSTASGDVLVGYQINQGSGSTRSRVLLTAEGLPAGVPVTLVADGKPVGLYDTTPEGRLVVRQGAVPRKIFTGKPLMLGSLPDDVDVSNVQAVTVYDAAGQVLLSGSL